MEISKAIEKTVNEHEKKKQIIEKSIISMKSNKHHEENTLNKSKTQEFNQIKVKGWHLICLIFFCFCVLIVLSMRFATSVLGLISSWHSSGLLWVALSYFGLLWAALGCSGLLWAALGCSGLLWAILGCSWLLWAALGWAALGRSGLLWSALGCFTDFSHCQERR